LSTIVRAAARADDFGVVAMAMVGVAILEVHADGLDLALLRNAEPTREHRTRRGR
jgi:hypothetical protein